MVKRIKNNTRDNNTSEKEALKNIKGLIKCKKYSQAKAFLEEIIIENPRNTQALYLLGKVFLLEKNLEETIKISEKIIEMNNGYVTSAYKLLGEAYYFLNDFEKSETCLKQALKGDYDKAEILVLLSKLCTKYKKYVESNKYGWEAYSCATESYKNLVRSQLTKNYISWNKLKDARRCLNKINPRTKTDEEVKNYLLGKLEQIEGNYKESEKHLKAVMKSKNKIYKSFATSDNIKNYMNKGEMQDSNKKDSNSYFIKKDLALVAERVLDFDTAINYYKEFLKENIYISITKNKIAYCYYSKQEYEKAKQIFEEIIEDQKILPDLKNQAFLNMSAIFLRENDLENAKEYLNKVNVEEIIRLSEREYNIIYDYLYNKPFINKNLFVINQINNYSLEEAIQHIKIRHFLNGERVTEESLTFNPNVNLEKIFDYFKEIKEQLTMYPNGCMNTYYIKIPLELEIINQKTQYIKVVTFFNNENVITMFPYLNIDELNQKEKVEKEKPLIKRLSQTDKFYKKYGKQD